MIIGFVLVLAIGAAIVVGLRRLGRNGGVAGGSAVRRFFQYLLLYGLLVVVAVGLSGLLARLLSGPDLVRFDEAQLARSLTFVLIGGPLYAGVAVWSRRRMLAEPGENRSLGWVLYATLASLTALVTSMVALHDLLSWAVGIEDYAGESVAAVLVWGAVWAGHWWVDGRVTPPDRSQVHHLLGSLIGLGTAFMGLASLLGSALDSLLGLGADIVAGGESVLLRNAVTLAVGAPVWALYWLGRAAHREKTALWVAYVLLFGVGGGLVAALTAAGTLLYDVLVWLVGDPRTDDTSRYFADAPEFVGAVVVGAVVWWYHRSVLEERPGARTEVRRVYEYLMAGIGLLAAAGGLVTVLVAFLEAVAGGGVVVGGSTVNTLLGAVTFLLVGAPVWWAFWRRIQRAEPGEERAAPTRRVYLFLLFGVGGVAAVIALIAAVFILMEDAFEGTVGGETIRGMRYAVGVLVATGAIAAYHWAVYRTDREHAPALVHGPRYVLLIGAPDAEIARRVAHRTGGRVQIWPRTDDQLRPWSVDDVVTALADTGAEEVVVVAEGDGLRVIPVQRP